MSRRGSEIIMAALWRPRPPPWHATIAMHDPSIIPPLLYNVGQLSWL